MWPNPVDFVSSNQITLVQSSTVQFLYLRAKSNLLFLCLTDKRGFFFLTTAFKDAALRTLQAVWAEIEDARIGLMKWVAWTALSPIPVVILETILLLSNKKSLEGCPNLTFSFSGRSSLMTLATVDFPRAVLDAICLAERPDSKRTWILALLEVGMDFVVWWGQLKWGTGYLYCLELCRLHNYTTW